MFINGAFTLSAEEISLTDLNKPEDDIELAVAKFQDEFGERFMVCNTHLCMHTAECVRKCGPLWCTSTIPFESRIGQLKKFVNGPAGVEHQIAIKHLQIFRIVTSNKKEAKGNEEVDLFCKNLFSNIQICKESEKKTALFREEFKTIHGQLAYKKVIYNKITFTCSSYNRSTIFRDSYIEFNSNRFGQIEYFINTETDCICYVKVFKTAPFTCNNYEVFHIKKVIDVSHFIKISVDKIKKVAPVEFENEVYLYKIPNTFEKY